MSLSTTAHAQMHARYAKYAVRYLEFASLEASLPFALTVQLAEILQHLKHLECRVLLVAAVSAAEDSPSSRSAV